MTLDSILSADPQNPTVDPVPYVGVQFAAIRIATEVSQEFSAVYAGQQTVEEALSKAQALTNDAMEAAGYRKALPARGFTFSPVPSGQYSFQIAAPFKIG